MKKKNIIALGVLATVLSGCSGKEYVVEPIETVGVSSENESIIPTISTEETQQSTSNDVIIIDISKEVVQPTAEISTEADTQPPISQEVTSTAEVTQPPISQEATSTTEVTQPSISQEATSTTEVTQPDVPSTVQPVEQTSAVPNTPIGTSPIYSEGNGVLIGGAVQTVNGYTVAGNAVYLGYGYADSLAEKYGNAITAYANDLSGQTTVYSMIIPSNAIVMPDEYAAQVNFGNQIMDIGKMYSRMGANVRPVYASEAIAAHKNEFLYFRTDHHWTQLGAYYAFTEFCKASGRDVPPIEAYQTVRTEGYFGSMYNTCGGAAVLGDTPEFLRSFLPRSNSDLVITTTEGAQVAKPVVNTGIGASYLAYIAGDWPVSVITNHDRADGRTCLIIKDSFGNPFVPFLADEYNYVYIIDYRYFNGGIISFIREHNVQDLIIENAMALADSSMVQWLNSCRY